VVGTFALRAATLEAAR
jgi:transposase